MDLAREPDNRQLAQDETPPVAGREKWKWLKLTWPNLPSRIGILSMILCFALGIANIISSIFTLSIGITVFAVLCLWVSPILHFVAALWLDLKPCLQSQGDRIWSNDLTDSPSPHQGIRLHHRLHRDPPPLAYLPDLVRVRCRDPTHLDQLHARRSLRRHESAPVLVPHFPPDFSGGCGGLLGHYGNLLFACCHQGAGFCGQQDAWWRWCCSDDSISAETGSGWRERMGGQERISRRLIWNSVWK